MQLKNKKIFLISALIIPCFFVMLSGCGLSREMLQVRIWDFISGTTLDQDKNVSGSSSLYTNVGSIYVGGKIEGFMLWDDPIRAYVFIDNEYYRTIYINSGDTRNDFYGEISPTIEGTSYLPGGVYYVKLSNSSSDVAWPGGETTFSVSVETP